MIQRLQPIELSPAAWQMVAKKILRFWKDTIFQRLAEIHGQKLSKVENATLNALENALRSGFVYYADGAFRCKGKFSNAISTILKNMGAEWSKSKKAYLITEHFLPNNITQTLTTVSMRNESRLEQMRSYLNSLTENMDKLVKNISFKHEYEKITQDGEHQFRTTMHKINVIPFELDEARKKVLYEQYTTNMDFYIKKWTEDEIIKLRSEVEGFVFEGYRYDTVAKMIQKRYDVSARKASFLARNETKILISKYQQDRFQSYGINFYQWKTNMDGRERHLHAILNGTIQNWANPPIIGDKGEHGNPGETYNCRCKALPLLPNDARIREGNRNAVLV